MNCAQRWGSLLAVAALGSGVAASGAAAQSPAVVLQLPASTRAAAMGNAYFASDRDDAAVFYNPGQLAGASAAPLSVGFSVQRYVQASHAAAISTAFGWGPGRVGVGLQLLDFGSEREIVPDENFGGERGRETGADVGARDFVASVGYGVQLAVFRVGATAKLVNQQVADLAGSTPAFDAGIALPTTLGTIGMVMQHQGGSLTVGTTSAALPLVYRASVQSCPVRLRRSHLVGVVEASKVRETRGTWSGGAEWRIPASRQMQVSLRAGLRGRVSDNAGSRLTFGGGMSATRYGVDYAYQTVEGLEVGTHRVGFRWWR